MRLGTLSSLVLCSVIAMRGVLLSASYGANHAGNEPGGQVGGIRNPLEGDPEAIRLGAADYSARCASCHGADAKGTDRASDLAGVWSAGETDQELAQIVRRGVANTLLPHSFGPDKNVWQILAYLKTLNTRPSSATPLGDPGEGKSVFAVRCAGCHEVNGSGGNLGPDLTHVGSARSRPFLAQKIRHPSSYIMAVYSGGNVTDGYQPITLVTLDGKRIRGVQKNEDAFSIQIMDSQQRLQGYLKTNLREVVKETRSLMPEFDVSRLSEQDLQDLVAYLGTLRDAKGGRP
jgi:cytochrome c oxidase cbb3-type subunit 3